MREQLDFGKAVADTEGLHGVHETRARIRRGEWTGHTSGLAEGHVQGNVVILPQAVAGDFYFIASATPSRTPCWPSASPGRRNCPCWVPTSTFVPTCRATACGGTAS